MLRHNDFFIGGLIIKKLKILTILAAYLTIFLFVALILPIKNKYPISEDSDSKMNDSFNQTTENMIEKKYNSISQKVMPYIVHAEVQIDNNKYIAEIIEDKGNGTTYCVNVDNKEYWIDKYYVNILVGEELKLAPLENEEIEFYVNYNGFESKTDFFIWVDVYRNETYILKKINNYFYLERRLICSTGANITPTKRGMFEITQKGTHFYGRDNTYICYNFLQYCGSYLLHSFPYSFSKEVIDGRLSERVSQGCVRFSFDDSKYLYDKIPLNTLIWVN